MTSGRRPTSHATLAAGIVEPVTVGRIMGVSMSRLGRVLLLVVQAAIYSIGAIIAPIGSALKRRRVAFLRASHGGQDLDVAVWDQAAPSADQAAAR